MYSLLQKCNTDANIQWRDVKKKDKYMYRLKRQNVNVQVHVRETEATEWHCLTFYWSQQTHLLVTTRFKHVQLAWKGQYWCKCTKTGRVRAAQVHLQRTCTIFSRTNTCTCHKSDSTTFNFIVLVWNTTDACKNTIQTCTLSFRRTT